MYTNFRCNGLLSPSDPALFMQNPVLEAQHLTCERDDRYLFRDLSFQLLPGSLTRIEGPNGAGKTTLLRILCGLMDFYEGEVIWRGESRRSVQEAFNRETLYLGHKSGVKTLLTPLENLAHSLAARRAIREDQLLQALEAVGLAGYETVPCHSLSAGQQRRVALARLLLSDEPLWILDEPFTAIDLAGVAALEQCILDRVAAGGTVVLTTHHDFKFQDLQSIKLMPVPQAFAYSDESAESDEVLV